MSRRALLVSLVTLFVLVDQIPAQPVNRKIAFPKFNTPPGYERYDPDALSSNAAFIFGGLAVPFPYRSFVKGFGGFTYDISTEPGVYNVKFGWYEFPVCSSGQRVFRISANKIFTKKIDVFAAVKCNKPYHVTLSNIRAPDGIIKLVAEAISGSPPFLSNVEITRTSLISKPASKNPSPSSPVAPTGKSSVVAKVVFTKSAPPSGWERYKQKRLSKSVQFSTTKDSKLPTAYRSHARVKGGFKYTQPVPPGTYKVILGFAEFQSNTCAVGKRVFRVQVNSKSTGDIDTFKAVKCRKVYTRSLRVVVQGKGKLAIGLSPVSGGAPFLANFQVIRISGAKSPAAPSGPPPSASSSPPSTGGSPRAGKVKIVKDIDAGGASDVPANISGSSFVYPNFFPIAGTTDDGKFSRHRFGMSFTYSLSVKPNIVYNVNLFFAESYLPGCVDGFRIFDVSAYDGDKAVGSGKSLMNLDVFKEAGCRTALSRSLNAISVGSSGVLAIKFTGTKQNAMVSLIQITTSDKKYQSSPTSTPKASNGPGSGPTKTFVEVDVGATSDINVPGTTRFSTTASVVSSTSISESALKTSRYGADFIYSFDLKPGAYDVLLAFSENFDPKFCSEAGQRVFNVYINEMIQMEGFDIFAEAGCRKGLEKIFSEQTVGAVDIKPLTIRFTSIVNYAQVNYIKIKRSETVCIPESTTGKLSADHAAHSVPGSYPRQTKADSPKTYVDTNGSGFVDVYINGGASHTHFFDPANNIIGRITDFTWTLVETKQVISKAKAFMYRFPLGTTRLKLAVIDNSCTSDEAETTITVTGAIQPGQYCYYYAGLKNVPFAGKKSLRQRPEFAAVSQSAQLGFPSFSFDKTKFAARCLFFLEVNKDSLASKITLSTFGTGVAQLYKGEDLIIDTRSKNKAQTSLSVGLIGFEVVYLRTNLGKAPKLQFLVNDKVPAASKISHDRTTVRPILTSVTPKTGPIGGGTNVKVTGYGLFHPLSVQFGDVTTKVLSSGREPTQFFVTSPPAAKAGAVKIVAKSGAGVVSNAVNFAYGSTCDSIGFGRTAMLQSNGDDVFNLLVPTCASIAQDGRIYMGTIGGTVQVLGYDSESLTTTSHCFSKVVRDPQFTNNSIPSVRAILGITFDPRDKIIRPYISTSTTFWHSRKKVDLSNKRAWQNGAVDRMKPGTDPTNAGICVVYDKRIVSNLPVSNHDHSVNALMFTQTGDLLIAVGGFTNLGLPGFKLGGYWETQLSAAILIAKLSKPGFNGEIIYENPTTPRLARKISGDVDLYVTGLRNCFAMTMTGEQEIYASDQGPNCQFGDTASSCSDYDEGRAKKWDPFEKKDWKGKVQHGWNACPYGIGRPDKILHITKGSWYGHPNLQRGAPECAWIDPFDHLTADDKRPPSKYKKPITTEQSSITGISEYRANHFCGKLRGELILSTYKSGKTYRMRVDDGTLISGPDAISEDGGITFVENARGDLIFPRLDQKNVFVLRPRVGPKASLFIAGAVPFRHGKMGGTLITIAGSNFGPLPSVQIGNKPCTVTISSDSEITCAVPQNSKAGFSKNLVVRSSSGESAVLPKAVLYMNV